MVLIQIQMGDVGRFQPLLLQKINKLMQPFHSVSCMGTQENWFHTFCIEIFFFGSKSDKTFSRLLPIFLFYLYHVKNYFIYSYKNKIGSRTLFRLLFFLAQIGQNL